MKNFIIEADLVTDEEFGDFALDPIDIMVYRDGTLEMSQPEFGDGASCIGLSQTQAARLQEILTEVLNNTISEEESDEKALDDQGQDIPLPVTILKGVDA